jgi:hypothetical protein
MKVKQFVFDAQFCDELKKPTNDKDTDTLTRASFRFTEPIGTNKSNG